MEKHLEPQAPCDAFTLWSFLRGFPRYNEMAVAQLDPLRRSNGYRFRLFTAPELNPESSDNVVIQAYERYLYQFRVSPGSWLWGIGAIGNITAKVSTSCSGGPLNREFISFTLTGVARPQPLIILDQPLCVLANGLVDVDIANNTGEDLLNGEVQLIFYVAEAPDRTTEMMPGVSTPLR